MNKNYLVIIDVDKIQDFIFRNIKLRPIFGSSFLISLLTSYYYCKGNTILKSLDEKQNLIDLVTVNNGYLPLFFDGGVIKIIFSTKEKAIQFIEDMQKEFINKVPAATFSHVIYEFFDFNHSILECAEKRLARIKKSKMYSFNPNTNPLFKSCSWCRTYPANFILSSAKTKEWLCEQCKASFDAYNKFNTEDSDVPLRVFHKDFKEKFKCDFKIEFDEIKDSKGFIAVVKMDADDLGDKLIELTRDKKNDECINTIKNFSNNLNKNVLELLLKSFDKIFSDDDINIGELPIRPIIIGGDDICLVMAGDKAIKFILNFLNGWNSIKFFKEYAITFSIGICFVKAHYPFTLAHRLAEELLKNAKKEKPRENDDIWHTIDWEVLHTSTFEDLDALRKARYKVLHGIDEHVLTYKPYMFKNSDPRDFKNMIDSAKILKDILKSSKFKRLREIVRENFAMSSFEFKKMTSKLSREDRDKVKKILQKFDMMNSLIWCKRNGKVYNNFLDMVEIFDFIGDA